MKVLIVGNGGREHALLLKLKKSPRVREIHCLHGNAGMVTHAIDHDIAGDDVAGIAHLAGAEGFDLVVVGPEAPLVKGLTDVLEAMGVRVFGPTRAAARLEGSKAFSKEIMWEAGIPTASGKIFDSPAVALSYIIQTGAPLVVKADGLAAGKGVFICHTVEEAEKAVWKLMQGRIFGDAGDTVVIEEMMEGKEVSLLFFTDGKTALPMLPAQDHKRIFDNDQGPNTGGMGAFAPAETLSSVEVADIQKRVVEPVLAAMAKRGTPYRGVLYVGLMLTSEGPKILEFNARFGDPEAQVILPLLKNDLVDVMDAVIDGHLDQIELEWHTGYCLGVVLASKGYPAQVEDDHVVSINSLDRGGDWLIHAGTRLLEGRVHTKGGRIFTVTATGNTMEEVREKAYNKAAEIVFSGCQYRQDIGK